MSQLFRVYIVLKLNFVFRGIEYSLLVQCSLKFAGFEECHFPLTLLYSVETLENLVCSLPTKVPSLSY